MLSFGKERHSYLVKFYFKSSKHSNITGNNKDLLLLNIWHFSGFLLCIKTTSHIIMDIMCVPFFNPEMSIILPEIKCAVLRFSRKDIYYSQPTILVVQTFITNYAGRCKIVLVKYTF